MGMLKKTKVKIFIGSTPPVEITDTKISLKSFEVLDDKKDEIEQAISDAFSIPKDSIISDMKRDILDNTQEYRRYKLVKSLELQSIQANILLDDSNDFFDRIRVTKLSNQHVNVMIELMLPRDDLSGHQLERLVKDIVEYIRTNMNRDINTEEMKKFVLKSCNPLTEKNFNTLDWKDHLFREGVYMKLSEQGDYSGFAEEFNG